MSKPLHVVSSDKPRRKYLLQSTRLFIYKRDKGICYICGEPTRFHNSSYDTPFDKDPKAGSVDHIVPVSLGGTNDLSNLRWACRECNCSRGNRDIKKRGANV